MPEKPLGILTIHFHITNAQKQLGKQASKQSSSLNLFTYDEKEALCKRTQYESFPTELTSVPLERFILNTKRLNSLRMVLNFRKEQHMYYNKTKMGQEKLMLVQLSK